MASGDGSWAAAAQYIYIYRDQKNLTVRYHDDGSKKLNTCILLLSHMVYL